MKEERIYDMKEYIKHNKYVSIDNLSTTFGVSLNTVRRDLKTITLDNHFNKVHGGVEYAIDIILPFEDRNRYLVEEKYHIAKLASEEIQHNDIIFIDAGTTTQYIPEFLDLQLTLTVITNSLEIITRLIKFPNIKIIVLGEVFNRKTNSFVSIDPNTIIERYNIQKAFLAATAVSIESGVSNSDNNEYFMKKYITEKANTKFLLVSRDKFDQTSLVTYAQLNQMDVVITNDLPSQRYTTYFKDHNIRLIY